MLITLDPVRSRFFPCIPSRVSSLKTEITGEITGSFL